MCGRALAEKLVVELGRLMERAERGVKIDDPKLRANLFREWIVEERQRLERGEDDPPQNLRRDVADLRIDRDDRSLILLGALEFFPVRTRDLQRAPVACNDRESGLGKIRRRR